MEKTKRITYSDNADIKNIDDNFKVVDELIDFNKSLGYIAISPSNWTENHDSEGAVYYTHKYTVENLSSNDTPDIGIKIEDDMSIKEIDAIKKEFLKNFVWYECANGKITICFKRIPTRTYNLELKRIGA